MPETGIRNNLSLIPIKIETYTEVDTSKPLGTATAFYYCNDGQWFLITNWHVVTGHHFLSRKINDEKERSPAMIRAHLYSQIGAHPTEIPAPHLGEGISVMRARPAAYDINLYENDTPVWFEHPEHGHLCDVVAIPFPRPDRCAEMAHRSVNNPSDDGEEGRIPWGPGTTVFIIGFPHGISTGNGLPVYKSGYVASEPASSITLSGAAMPAFLIDSQTRQGMSGAPVFAEYTGIWDPNDPYSGIGEVIRPDMTIGSQTQFIGCYSGRLLPGRCHQEDAALGLCWPENIIQDICTAKHSGTDPLVRCTMHPADAECQI